MNRRYQRIAASFVLVSVFAFAYRTIPAREFISAVSSSENTQRLTARLREARGYPEQDNHRRSGLGDG
ncbi:hypothetical protein HDU93_004925, partial [Gonapodya sp. JEL0774]